MRWYELPFKSFADFAVDLMWFIVLIPFISKLFILYKKSKNSSFFPSSVIHISKEIENYTKLIHKKVEDLKEKVKRNFKITWIMKWK